MGTLLEIENGIARLVERNIRYELPTAQVAQFLNEPISVQTPLLPVGTISVAITGDNILSLIVERAPHPVHLKLAWRYSGKEHWAVEYDVEPDDLPEELTLKTPWEYYLMSGPIAEAGNPAWSIHSSSLYWSLSRITALPARVYAAVLPNIDPYSGYICYGNTATAGATLAEKVNALINTFYDSEFNDHMGHMDLPESIRDIVLRGDGKVGFDNQDIFGCPAYQLSGDRLSLAHATEAPKLFVPTDMVYKAPALTANYHEIAQWLHGGVDLNWLIGEATWLQKNQAAKAAEATTTDPGAATVA